MEIDIPAGTFLQRLDSCMYDARAAATKVNPRAKEIPWEEVEKLFADVLYELLVEKIQERLLTRAIRGY